MLMGYGFFKRLKLKNIVLRGTRAQVGALYHNHRNALAKRIVTK